MTVKGPANPERSFGISVGTVVLVIAGVLVWRGHTVRAEVLAIVGAVLLTFGLVYPPLLKYPSRAWWRFSHVLGRINARILMTLLFGIIVVPLSAIWRTIGKDPLTRDRSTFPGWSPYPVRYRNPKHFDRMF